MENPRRDLRHAGRGATHHDPDPARAHLAAIVASSSDAIVGKTLDSTIVSWNAAATRIFGYTAEEAIGRSILMLIPPERHDEERVILERVARGERIEHVETVRMKKDGSRVEVSLSISPVCDENGTIIGAAKIARDITERKRVEEQLRRAKVELELRVEKRTAELRALTQELIWTERRERKKMAQALHEGVQQILAALKVQAELALALPGQSGPIRGVLRRAEEAIASCRSLALELSPPVLWDGDATAGLRWLARQLADQHGLRVTLDVREPVPVLAEDLRVLFFEIARELLLDFLRHGRAEPAAIALLQEGTTLVLAISHVRPRDGGIALSSIRERVAGFGGRIDFVSAEDGGCGIRISVPQNWPGRNLAGVADGPNNSRLQLTDAKRLRVLLADDHQILRQGLAELLDVQPDLEVVAQASDGVEAVELARQLKPDVVVMDITMPRMSGIAATRTIHEELPGVRVVALSMHERADMASAMREAGAAAFVTKAGPVEELLAALRGQSSGMIQ